MGKGVLWKGQRISQVENWRLGTLRREYGTLVVFVRF